MFEKHLAELAAEHLTRRLLPLESGTGPVVRIAGREVLLFASNDYLGLACHPEVVDAMRTRGLDVSVATPQKLTPELAATANWLITMGCGDECPIVPGASRDDWPIQDPRGQPPAVVDAIIEDIDRRVRLLIERLF